MNITSIYANSKEDVSLSTQKDTSSSSDFQKGDVVEGVITKVSDQISISFSGREVNVSKSTVLNATEGEIRKFKIMDVSNQSIVLKEVGNNTSNTSGKATWTNVETFKKAFGEYQAALEKNCGVEDKEEQLLGAANRMTSKDYDELIKEGKYLKAYNLTQLDRALDRIKEQRQVKEESVKTQVEDTKEDKKDVEKIGYKNKAGSASSDDVEQKLEDSNLPVTDENIKRFTKAFELGQSVYSMSEKSQAYLIEHELEPTIQNIYKAGYSTSSVNQATPNVNFESVKKQAEDIMKEAGIEVNEESMKNAKWLFDNNLPLTKDSFERLDNLNNIKENMTDEKLANYIVDAMSKGINSTDASLDNTSIQLVKNVIDNIGKISDAAIIKVANSSQDITIQNLMNATQELNNSTGQDSVIDSSKINTNAEYQTDIDIKAVTAKRQLEEIRLKLTVEAGQKLASKGIQIDTENLQKVVDGLKEIESNYYKSLLQESNTLDSTENINLLKDTTSKISALRNMPSYILGSTLSSRDNITLDGLHTEGTNLKSKLDKANQTYDTLMTSPRKDLGDSIQKAFRNVDDILEDLKIPKTEANQRAVKILGYNSMDINEDNISKVKEYDLKVNTLIDNLKPAVTVNLIKDGINPLDTPLDTLNALTDQVSEELGATEEEKYSEYLWKLEKKQGITESERKTYIGVYRLLNNIEKSDGAAIGSVLNANQEMTLNNLLTAVRTLKSNGVDKKVDDSFGALESITFRSDTITSQLSSTFNDSSISAEEKYQRNLTESILNELTPSKIADISENNDLMDISLENLKEKLQVSKDDEKVNEEYNAEQAQILQALSKDSKDAISLLNEYQIPTTLEYISASKEFIQDNTYFKKVIEKANSSEDESSQDLLDEMEGLIDALDDRETMTSQYDKIDQNLSNIIKKELENTTITSKNIADLKALSNSMSFVKELSNKEYYQIPIEVNGEVTNINLTVVKQNEEAGKVSVKVDSKNLGLVEATFTVKSGELKGLILSDNKDTLDNLSNLRENFADQISQAGIEVKQLDYGTSNQISSSYIKNTDQNRNRTEEIGNSEEGKATTRQLYQVAKAFVLEVKNLAE
ncbi:DUF6240 domain-containing protein [Anaeromicropila herbilytica]|uniref:Flagellar hook-length control protein FliK n=1 Tax=Anaeromicropila herbilytica TaxID=2785025 RepID=A0A7R7EQ90_9FIRM|nr:DUF6240 domain-containing protein [Anaeromicropila herbilytica]BCN32954.1 hypothetical protein bsdtb5_42490 [Anaeromicropila herbilytica]